MASALPDLIRRLGGRSLRGTGVIPWSSPVPSFGDHLSARVGTVGINPSNREFVNARGDELTGECRRFHTLQSLGISSWLDANDVHLDLVARSCSEYFMRNPYDQWFRRLNYLIEGAGMSYYEPSGMACHLDLIPYATASKWTELSQRQRAALLDVAGDTLALLIRESAISAVVLNGRSVVKQFERLA